MIIFLYGKDTFRSRQHLRKIIAEFKARRDPQGLNVVILDCVKEELPNIMQEVLATPFLAKRKMVVLENFLSSQQKEVQKEILERLKQKNLPETNVLVFWEGTGEFKNKEAKELSEALSKEKLAQNFELLQGAKLSAWIEQEIKARGGTINRQALHYLAQNIGPDMWRMESLINQLVNYSESEINLSDIQPFIDEKIDDNIFNLVDAIIARQPKQAYQMIQEQYRQGKEPGYLFAMILRQFRILLELRDLFEREDNMSSDALAKKLGLHPYVVKKSLSSVKKYGLNELKNIYQELLEIDIKTKTGQGGQSLLLDLFVGRICAG